MLLSLRPLPPPPDGPARPTSVELASGRAHLVRPAADTVAVLVEADDAAGAGFPAPGRGAHAALFSAALTALRPALGGTDDDPPGELEARIHALWNPAPDDIFRRLFEPLGYAVHAVPIPLDPAQPRSGPSGYWVLELKGRQRPATLISHLRVLLALFDPRPRGERLADPAALWNEERAWLETHPARTIIERNLLGRATGHGLHDQRHDAVLAALRESGARRVLDLGCGAGTLLRRLLQEPQFDEVAGVEVVLADLAVAQSALTGGRGRAMHGSLAYRDRRLAGHDAAALVEVIEHMDPARLAACEDAVWATARPTTIVVTTPNAEYNALAGAAGRTRHPDHRFEWTRAEFRAWADGAAARHGYAVRYAPAGPEHPDVGPLTQMAVFTALGDPPSSGEAGASPAIPLEDVAGERTLHTRRGVSVRVRAEQSTAALEAMSRFAVDPRWLISLPPTEVAAAGEDGTSEDGGGEPPAAALTFYRARGVSEVALEERRAGTRVVAVVCRDADAARRRFGTDAGETGAIYTSSGQPFFAARAAEEAFLARLGGALEAGGAWAEMGTDWMALEGWMDGMPVLREVNPRLRPAAALYLAVGAAEREMLAAEDAALAGALGDELAGAGAAMADVRTRIRRRVAGNGAYLDACRRAFRPVRTAGELRFAPDRILAAGDAVHADRDPRWHHARLAPACAAAPGTLRATEQRVIHLADPAADADAAAWWRELQARGGAGLTVRPLVAAVEGRLLPPALRCRGADALRLVHGPGPLPAPGLDDVADAAERAVNAWALSLEALDRFTAGESVARVHACVFAALALRIGADG